MAGRRLLYYITDRSQFSGDEPTRRCALFDKISEAASAGVHYIQLREKDLNVRELEKLAREAVLIVRKQPQLTNSGERPIRLIINSRADVALAAGADGVHLRSDDVSPRDVRLIVDRMNHPPQRAANFLIGASCHSASDVLRAESEGADFVVFAPVFEKRDAPDAAPQGLSALREACRTPIPVLALGGVTLENAAACFEAGATGIAGIRLFQQNKISDVVRALQSI